MNTCLWIIKLLNTITTIFCISIASFHQLLLFIEHLFCSEHCAYCFTYDILFNIHNNPMKEVVITIPIW